MSNVNGKIPSPACSYIDEGWDDPIRNCPPVAPTSHPSPERNQYSNKEAAKINLGLPLLNLSAKKMNLDLAKILLSGQPIDLNSLPELGSPPSIERLVDLLTHPQPHAFVHGVLSIHWARAVLHDSQDAMVFRDADERYVLALDSKLRKTGKEYGMPEVYMEWLCGDDSEVTAAELELYLTPDFFEFLEGEAQASRFEEHLSGPPEKRKKSRCDC